jgi:hypothetical protein
VTKEENHTLRRKKMARKWKAKEGGTEKCKMVLHRYILDFVQFIAYFQTPHANSLISLYEHLH